MPEEVINLPENFSTGDPHMDSLINEIRSTAEAPKNNLPTSMLTGDPHMDSLLRNLVVNDSERDAISKEADRLNVVLDSSTKDYLMQYYLNEKAAENSYKRSLDASNTQYQRAVADLRKAGLNPFLALQSLGGSTPSSIAGSVQGGLYTSRSNQSRQSSTQQMASILGILGIIAAAFIHALI